MYCVVGDFSKSDQVIYERQVTETQLIFSVNNFLEQNVSPFDRWRHTVGRSQSESSTWISLSCRGLDFTPPDEQVVSEQAPCIVVTHGLTGGARVFNLRQSLLSILLSGSYESYVKSILAPACTPVKDGGLGYRAVVVNFRGCMYPLTLPRKSKSDIYISGADVPITSPQLYSAGHTDDLRQALMYIRKRYPHAPLLGVGFSLGANVLTRYIAEEGENCRLVAGCALACVSTSAEMNNSSFN